MVHQVGVQRVVAGDENRGRLPAVTSSAACLLPQRCSGAWPAGDEHGVQAGDVHAEFECGRRGQRRDLARAQRGLEVPALLWQVARTVSGDPAGLVGDSGVGEFRPGRGRGCFDAAARPDERERRDPVPYQVGKHVGSFADRVAAQGSSGRQRRLPHRERERRARRRVVGDRLDGQPGQQPRALGRVADRRRGKHENRRRDAATAMVLGYPAQPA